MKVAGAMSFSRVTLLALLLLPISLAPVTEAFGLPATDLRANATKASPHKIILDPESGLTTHFQAGEIKADNVEMQSDQWKAVFVLVSMILVAISPILVKDGLAAFAVVVTYLFCLSLVKMFVKATLSEGFMYPYSITMMHMFFTALIALCFERPRASEALKVLPISIMNGVSLCLNNTALVYGGVAFVSMLGCCTPVCTFTLEIFKGRRQLAAKSLLPVGIVCLGAMLCVKGETTASALAFCFASSATMFRAMKGVWQHELLDIEMPPMRLVFWSGFWSFLAMIPLVMLEEGAEAFKAFPSASRSVRAHVLLSCAAAAILNISQCYAVKQLGALLQSVVGNLNLILVIVLACAWLGETVRTVQYLGVGLLVIGTVSTRAADKMAENYKEKLPFANAAVSAPEGNSQTPPAQSNYASTGTA